MERNTTPSTFTGSFNFLKSITLFLKHVSYTEVFSWLLNKKAFFPDILNMILWFWLLIFQSHEYVLCSHYKYVCLAYQESLISFICCRFFIEGIRKFIRLFFFFFFFWETFGFTFMRHWFAVSLNCWKFWFCMKLIRSIIIGMRLSFLTTK